MLLQMAGFACTAAVHSQLEILLKLISVINQGSGEGSLGLILKREASNSLRIMPGQAAQRVGLSNHLQWNGIAHHLHLYRLLLLCNQAQPRGGVKVSGLSKKSLRL